MAPSSRQNRCCGEIDLSQIGSCAYCMVLAAVLTALGWTGFVLVTDRGMPWFSDILLIFSCLFSLLLVAHALTALGRHMAEAPQTAAVDDDPHSPQLLATPDLDRKE
ncbi:MAG TPA: hypothetical protein VHA78_01270 [Candidatus Peribacteraceae bacterium]|nr:hypothetical protein [Candidatus Peribacteraceae bacterium]